MSSLTQFLNSTGGARAVQAGQPGSNGFWRRDVFRGAGTYVWTASKAGKIKIQGIGAAAGGAGTYPGASGAFGEKTLTVAAGDQLTIVIGQGGAGASSGAPGNGGSSSISGTPIGGTPLTLAGAQGAAAGVGVAGVASGPWDTSYPGAIAIGQNTGSPSSGSPFGAGRASSGGGGAGWGGGAAGYGGASSHRSAPGSVGAYGLVAPGGRIGLDGGSQPFWDLRDIDGGGGGYGNATAQLDGGAGGVGAGGGASAATATYCGVSAFGGGTGTSFVTAPKSGFGGGGGCGVNAGITGGAGGDAWVAVFWDAVQ
ncbi:hypothetical protein SAMN06265338_1159 [Rhodoblastus acidophilus]|uniref:Uncharacterized protein n=1 Tax=Rhodoblastus acidophilus TaxID=1074 RepID=A0A212S7J3_RHOAC|nr:hypothetical protein [Rhodoblastus acidophilus]PPQ37072.1 hypothetical protein CKO16_15900 [Rhodoblastus acidophilus]RAI16679.1 hypothetical protein CH337_20140 [Rhodoblastus acidophilus]SNB81293.1 hypothetical protein SAMN06265338_1159 [Rhodoblastus acidophilus]